MGKRPRDETRASLSAMTPEHPVSQDTQDRSNDESEGSALKRPRSFMATLACNVCRSRKTRCDEDRPKCGYCRAQNLECNYQTPRATKKDQSMTVAINAIRRLEAKVEDLTAAVTTFKPSPSLPAVPIDPHIPDHANGFCSHTSNRSSRLPLILSRHDGSSTRESATSPPTPEPALASPFSAPKLPSKMPLSFSQHLVARWPACQQILLNDFLNAHASLPQDYIIELETERAPLPVHVERPYGTLPESWLMSLPQTVIKGLSDAYFAVFHRNTPILDKFWFSSNTLGTTMENEFGYDIETCLVLVVLALGCLAVRAHEEGNFALPSRNAVVEGGFERPDWYAIIEDNPCGLKFFNEARKRFGFLMCQNDLQAGQFYMLSTLYYAQILRPLDSWTTVNRAALCCTSILSRTETVNYDLWEGDMFSRLFWNTLMYETVITHELDFLPHSGLLGYETNVPLPKFTLCPRPKTSISGLLTDEDESFFNFHFLAQAAHRILLTRVRQNIYYFAERERFPSASLTAEMHHQLEQWRLNLPPSLQFTENENVDDSPSPAHVIAKAMLRSRYLVAKFHIGRPFLYKALHAPGYTNEAEYEEVRNGLRGGMFWPTTMGLCAQMLTALPLKFGWCCQCFGQILLFQAVARSPDPRLRDTLPEQWQEWVEIMMALIESCAQDSPGIAKDFELLRLLQEG